ncbi:MAG: amino acid adenylation domain-containing protein, partial [bacterium]|nr:amino acid adenylation domain-containing protein [bacterium]
HHAVADGTAGMIIFNELEAYYQKRLNGTPVVIQPDHTYENYVAYHLENFDTGKVKRFWQKKLAAVEPVVKNRSAKLKSKYTDYRIPLNPEGSRKVVDYCKAAGVSPAIYFKGLYGLMLHYYTRPAANFHIRDVASGRPPRYQTTIGPMILVIPTIVDVTRITGRGEVPIIEYLQDFRRQKKQLGDNQYISNTLQIQIMGRQELFFDYNFLALNSFKITNDKGIPLEIVEEEENTVTFRIEQTSEGFTLCFHYNEKEFFGERFMERLKHISRQILNGAKTVSELEYQFENERELLRQWNDTSIPFPQKTILQSFEEQVAATPYHIAVVGVKGQHLSYGELNEKSNRIARYLRTNRAIQPGELVGIMVGRNEGMISGVLGILKTGGVYVPLDSQMPPDRITYILNDSNCKTLLTEEKYIGNAKKAGKIPLATLQEIETRQLTPGPHSHPNPYPSTACALQSPAYVIYTSGSTGKPKGVIVEHGNLANISAGWHREYRLGDFKVRLLQLANISFDVFCGDICRTMLSGGRMIIASKDIRLDPANLYKLMVLQQINIFESTPALIIPLFDYIKENHRDIAFMKLLILGSDICQLKDFKKLLSHFGDKLRIINSYGTTETTIDSSYYESSVENLPNIGTVPIGKPMANTRCYILTPMQKPLPAGLAGELCICGKGLARGYLNAPQLTGRRFIPHPYEKGERLYKTGDFCCWLPDGNIEFLGRLDHQVKIRGFRIELGEIEKVLLTGKGIKETVVQALEDKNGDHYLTAYYVEEDKNTPPVSVTQLRELLSKKLPDYMIPAYFVSLEKLPLTANGKIDRKALPEPGKSARSSKGYRAPTNETEKKLVEIWQQVLGLKPIGITDNFFEMGGHSLKAITIITKIKKTFQVELPLLKLFENPFIKKQAQDISHSVKSIFTAVEAVEKKDYYPVSAAQKRLYALKRFSPESVNYNMPGALLIEGELSTAHFEEAFQKLIQRHESLRTSFLLVDAAPVQRVHDPDEIVFVVIHSEGENKYSPSTGQKDNHRGNSSDHPSLTHFLRPFDLLSAPLLRVELVKLEENKYIFLFDIHHIISDGVSGEIMVKEFSALYARQELKPLTLQYKEYAAWQNRFMKSPALLKQKKYWQEKFSGEVPVLNIPNDYQRPAIQSSEGATIFFEINEELTTKLHHMTENHGSTLYMVLLALFNILLARYGGQEDVIVGSPSAGRRHFHLKNIIGMFVNTLAMRNAPQPEKSVVDFLAEVKQNSLEAFENQDYQFDDLLEHLELKRDISRNPLFDTMFALQNLENEELEIKGLTFKPHEYENRISKFDISMQMSQRESKLFCSLEYCVKLFKKKTMERSVNHFVNILKEVVTAPAITLGQINMLSEAEEKQLLYEFNDTKADYPKDKTIHQLFEEQVERTPEHIAVVGNTQKENYKLQNTTSIIQLTYRELNQKSNQLASLLLEKGVEHDVFVGIMAERSIEMIIGIMSILKAGGAYLPIDPDYPEARKLFMMKDSSTSILLTTSSAAKETAVHKKIINIEDVMSTDIPRQKSGIRQQASSLAYVIYTSGSTGRPKGVLIDHAAIINTLTAMNEKYPLTAADAYLMKTAYSFDVSTNELFGWFLGGGRTVVLKNGDEKNPDKIISAIEKERITHINFVPSMLGQFMEILAGEPRTMTKLPTLKYIFSAGEALSPLIVEKFETCNLRCRLENIYGPTEAAVYASWYSLSDWSVKEPASVSVPISVPIGTPLNNIKLYIVNRGFYLSPIGVPGELCISGAGLSRGYLNNPALTSEKFVEARSSWLEAGREKKKETGSFPNNQYPITNNHIYRTGDLAKWLPDGNIEYLGRIDLQVKIRGFRIELGEIENLLLSKNNIKETIVTAKKDKVNNNYLVVYYVPNYTDTDTGTNKQQPPQSISQLRDFLSEKLPGYMIPSYFVPLEKLPLTPNGKIDRKALPAPSVITAAGTRYQAPGTDIEKKLVKIWQEVLDNKSIGIFDSFFLMGGDSIKAIQVAAKLLKHGLRMEIKDLFLHLTISKLAPFIKNQLIKTPQGAVSGAVSLTPIQQWFFNMDFTGKHHWNQSVMLYKKDGFDEKIVQSVMEAIVRHHDALRMSYPATPATGEKNIHRQYNRGPEGELFNFSITDFRNHGKQENQHPPAAGMETSTIEQRIEREAGFVQASIDLSTGPLVKIALFKTLGGDHLLLAIHHLVVDGVSWRILLEDFSTAYKQIEKGQAIRLPHKTTSFKEWSQKLSQYAKNTGTQWFAKEKAYWQKVKNSEIAPLPVDEPDGIDGADEMPRLKYCENVTVSFTKEKTEALLKDVNHAYNTEINDILLTALGMAVSRWTGESRVLINLEGHGREILFDNVDINRTVGWFTSKYPVILTMPESTHDSKDETQSQAANLSLAIRQTKENLRNIPNKGIGFGIVEYLAPVKQEPKLQMGVGVSHPEIIFNYLGQFGQDTEDGLFSMSGLSSGDTLSPDSEMTAKLSINGMIVDGRLSFDFTFSKTQYRKETILKLAAGFEKSLSALIEHCRDTKETTLTPGDYWPGILTISQLQKIENTIMPGEQKTDIEKVYPLTPMQEGMLFHYIYNENSSIYFEQFQLNIRGPLDRTAIDKSLRILTQKYDVLRTNFVWQGVERPIQVVRKSKNIDLYFENIAPMEEEEKHLFSKEFARKDRQKGFDLSRDNLLRVLILQTGENLFKIIWSMHHIIIDGWCTGILFGDFFNFYHYFRTRAGEESLTPRDLQRCGETFPLEENYRYIDYIRWLEKQDKNEALSAWKQYLLEYDEPAELPQTTGQSRRQHDDFQLETISFSLTEEVTRKLTEFSKTNNITFNVVFNCLWGLLLCRYNNRGDVLFGSVVSGRPPEVEGIDEMVGLFINTIPVRINIPRIAQNRDSGLTFTGLVKGLQKEATEIKKYDYFPLAELQSAAGLKGDLFDHIVVFENYPLSDEMKTLELEKKLGFSIDSTEAFSQTNYGFTLAVNPGENLGICFNYNGTLYNKEAVTRVKNHLLNISREAAENPGILLSNIKILSLAEEKQLLYEFNDTQADYPTNKTIHQLFEEQVERTPDTISIMGKGKTSGTPSTLSTPSTPSTLSTQLTYRELDEKSNQLATLLREKGVAADIIVGIIVERSIEMIIGIMGILKAGGAYLPIDPDTPEARKQFMLKDCSVAIVLTTRELAGEAVFSTGVVYLDEISPRAAQSPVKFTSSALAYIIYTSGSTGKPKGVMIEHRAIVNTLSWRRGHYSFGLKDIVLQLLSFIFDGSVTDIFSPIISGSKLVLLRQKLRLNLDCLADVIRKNRVTHLLYVPALYKAFLGTLPANRLEALKSLKYITLGGEHFTEDLVNEHFTKLEHVRLFNEYGPTENSVSSTVHEINPAKSEVLIGKPICNSACYILDRNYQLAPVGVAGELYLSGAGVARGYLNRPELTHEKFVTNHFSSSLPNNQAPITNNRLYKSGDLGRWQPEGNIQYLGRIDHQVKVRGFRIELGEIENLLLSHENIKETIVTAKKDKKNNHYLAAYYVCNNMGTNSNGEAGTKKPQAPITIPQLRDFLAEKLPDYMIPAYFVPLQTLPLTPIGKIDRKALPEPSGRIDTAAGYEAPRNPVEKKLTEIWQDVLGIESIGIHDSFFELGGDSIKAIHVLSKLQIDFQLTLNDIFQHQVLCQLAEKIVYKKNSLKLKIDEFKQSILRDRERENNRDKEMDKVRESALIEYRDTCKHQFNIDISTVIDYKNIMLTGATGYLGIHILHKLLETTNASIHVLVRGKNNAAAKERLLRKFAWYFNENPYENHPNRIFVIAGDIASPYFELSEKQYKELSHKIDCLINSAAYVKHYGRYEDFRQINVEGVKRMIDFSLTGKKKDFNHISTVSVASAAKGKERY